MSENTPSGEKGVFSRRKLLVIGSAGAMVALAGCQDVSVDVEFGGDDDDENGENGDEDGDGDGDIEAAPDTELTFEYNESTEELTISHGGGETITPDNTGKFELDYAGDDYSWGSGINPHGGISGEVAVGELIVTVEGVQDGDEVTLVWGSPDDVQSAALGSYEVDL